MIEFRVKGERRVSAKLKELSVNVRNKYAGNIAQKGYDYAVKIMPHYYGYLENSLEAVKNPLSGKLIQHQPQTPGERRPYHLWMARYGQYPQVAKYIRSGKPDYMKLSFAYMRKISKSEFSKLIK